MPMKHLKDAYERCLFERCLWKIGQMIIWKKSGFNGYIYDFSTDYNAITVSDILDIHKYLMKNNRIV